MIGGSFLTESLPVEEILEFFVTLEQSDLEQGQAQNSLTIKQETPVQRCRRKKKEKTEANKKELARLDDAKEEMVLQLRELKGELKIMSELSSLWMQTTESMLGEVFAGMSAQKDSLVS